MRTAELKRGLRWLGAAACLYAAVSAHAAGLVGPSGSSERPLLSQLSVDSADLRQLQDAGLDLTVLPAPGSLLDPDQAQRGVELLRKVYREQGFWTCMVRAEIRSVGPSAVALHYVVEPGAKAELRLAFVGNRQFSTAELRDALPGSGEQALFSEAQREFFALLLTAYYYDHGYIQVQLAPYVITPSSDGRILNMTLSIAEGEQYRLGGVSVQGELLRSAADTLRTLPFKTGDVFNRTQVSNGIMSLHDELRDAGYAVANVTPSTVVDTSTRAVHITFAIERGPLMYINSISFEGTGQVPPAALQAAVRLRPGDRFNQTALAAAKSAILARGDVEAAEVRTEPATGQSDRVDVIFKLQERAAPDPRQPPPGARVEPLAVPPADPRLYEEVSDDAAWKNPSLIVQADGVQLVAANVRRSIALHELDAAFAGLPATAWPYGRVVAVQEQARRGGGAGEAEAIAANKNLLAAWLCRLDMTISWWPSD